MKYFVWQKTNIYIFFGYGDYVIYVYFIYFKQTSCYLHLFLSTLWIKFCASKLGTYFWRPTANLVTHLVLPFTFLLLGMKFHSNSSRFVLTRNFDTHTNTLSTHFFIPVCENRKSEKIVIFITLISSLFYKFPLDFPTHCCYKST